MHCLGDQVYFDAGSKNLCLKAFKFGLGAVSHFIVATPVSTPPQ